jgi:hypothetical protein
MSSIVGYLAPVERWPFDWLRMMGVIDCRMGLDVGWAAIDAAETPTARQTNVWITYMIGASGSRLIVTSSGRVTEFDEGSPLRQVVFFSPLVAGVS